MLVGSREKIGVEEQTQLFYRAESSYWWQDDGPHVDGVNGHRVEVGVDVLPKSRRQKMLFWIVTLIQLSTMMAM